MQRMLFLWEHCMRARRPFSELAASCNAQALTHAKTAHIKAVQAQAELQAAQKARQDAELAERHRMEVSL